MQVPYNPNTDFDERFVRCMAALLLAEAQEVTIERARNKGHKADLIAGLASDNKVAPGPKKKRKERKRKGKDEGIINNHILPRSLPCSPRIASRRRPI